MSSRVLALYLILLSLSHRVAIACQDMSNFFQCSKNNRCIDKRELCDGFEDCLDGEDETFGCQIKFNCSGPLNFLCQDHKCIPRSFYCDGHADCEDGSDEINCTDYIGQCLQERSKYSCNYVNQCIPWSLVCNNKEDCQDGSDEGGLCLSKSPLKTCNCHDCIRTPDDDVCVCKKGYKPVNDTCEDIDECHLKDVCEQVCTNIPGSYRCSCSEGYSLQSDRRTCRMQDLLHNNSVAQMVYRTNNSTKIITKLGSNTYYIKDKILTQYPCKFITAYTSELWKCITFADRFIIADIFATAEDLLNKSGTLIFNDLRATCASSIHMETDYVTGNLYVVCKQVGILVCSWNHELCSLIRPANNNTIKRIALSSKHGLMFWLETMESKDVQIVRASMNGLHEEIIFRDDLASAYPHHELIVDSFGKRLYYFNPRSSHIESINFDGTGREVVKTGVHRPLALGIYEDELYWSVNDSNKLFSTDKYTGRGENTVVKGKSPINSLIINSFPPDESIIRICRENFCSDLCLLTSEESDKGPIARSACACSYRSGTVLSMDGISCQYTTILASNIMKREGNNNLFIVGNIFSDNPKIERIGLDGVHNISCMTYDPISGNVFLFDSIQKILFTYNLKSRQLHSFSSNMGMITWMQYDGVSNNLYIYNKDTRALEILSLTTSRKATLLRNLPKEDRLISFSLALQEGLIYVAFSKHINESSSKKAKNVIEFISLNDTSWQGNITSNLLETKIIRRMVIDEEKRLIWLSVAEIEGYTWDEEDVTHEVTAIHIDTGYINDFYDITNPSTDLAIANGIVFYTTKASARIESIQYNHDFLGNGGYLDLITENGKFLKNAHLRIAPVSEYVNTSSPCFQDNGNCDHVCLITNAKSFTKRCLCEESYTLARDGLHCHHRTDKSAIAKGITYTSTSTFITWYTFYIIIAGITAVGILTFVHKKTNLGSRLRNRLTLINDGIRNGSSRTDVSTVNYQNLRSNSMRGE